MNDIQIFNNPDFGEIRTLIIDGEPWFVSKDISDKLGYAKPANMVKLVDEDDKRNLRGSDLEPGSKAQISAVNESGLYAAIFGSKQENAKKFKRWVTSEVLPSIRKTGEYKQEGTRDIQGKIKLLAQGTTELYERMGGLEERFNHFEKSLPLLPNEADELSNAVKKRVVEVLGGKDAPAYKNRGICQKAFKDAYRELKRNFNVSRYKDIKREQKEEAVEIAGKYEPPLFLKNMIEQENNQITMDKV